MNTTTIQQTEWVSSFIETTTRIQTPATTNLIGAEVADRNLHCRVTQIDDLRIAVLDGALREQVWTPPVDWLYESPEELPALWR